MQDERTGPNPGGLCLCGCGRPAPLARTSSASNGNVQGKPQRYCHGHAGRKSPVPYVVDENGCWVWQGALGDGYGLMRSDGAMRRAHRVYWERTNGAVPDGLQLDHLCRNRACVNPEHLEPVTQTENVRRGAGARLTVAEVAEIRALCRDTTLTAAQIASRYGVRPNTVQRIRQGRLWKGVTPAAAPTLMTAWPVRSGP